MGRSRRRSGIGEVVFPSLGDTMMGPGGRPEDRTHSAQIAAAHLPHCPHAMPRACDVRSQVGDIPYEGRYRTVARQPMALAEYVARQHRVRRRRRNARRAATAQDHGGGWACASSEEARWQKRKIKWKRHNAAARQLQGVLVLRSSLPTVLAGVTDGRAVRCSHVDHAHFAQGRITRALETILLGACGGAALKMGIAGAPKRALVGLSLSCNSLNSSIVIKPATRLRWYNVLE